jgi:pyruvate/2-oxoglutarate/acetoin dehydrogenase E1 component
MAYGTIVHVAEAAAAETGIDAEIVDLRTLLPLDLETIEAHLAEVVARPRRHRPVVMAVEGAVVEPLGLQEDH